MTIRDKFEKKKDFSKSNEIYIFQKQWKSFIRQLKLRQTSIKKKNYFPQNLNIIYI